MRTVTAVPEFAYNPGSSRRDQNHIVARLVANGVGVVKAGKIAKAALRTSDPVATAERMYREHRRVVALKASVAADREYGRPLVKPDPTGEHAAYLADGGAAR